MVVGGTRSNFVVEVAIDLWPTRTEKRDKPVGLLARNGEVVRFRQSRSKTFVTRYVPVRYECHHAQARNARLTGIQRGKRAVGQLLCCQPIKCPVDGRIDTSPFVGGEDVGGRVVAHRLRWSPRCNGGCHSLCGRTLCKSRR